MVEKCYLNFFLFLVRMIKRFNEKIIFQFKLLVYSFIFPLRRMPFFLHDTSNGSVQVKKHHEVAAKLKNLGSEFLFSAVADVNHCTINSSEQL